MVKITESPQKRRAFEILGSRCSCCGETDLRLLETSHISRDGKKQRKKISNVERWVVKHQEKAKKEVWLLCANCHRIYDYYPEDWNEYTRRKKSVF
jgi:hypothetical protein